MVKTFWEMLQVSFIKGNKKDDVNSFKLQKSVVVKIIALDGLCLPVITTSGVGPDWQYFVPNTTLSHRDSKGWCYKVPFLNTPISHLQHLNLFWVLILGQRLGQKFFKFFENFWKILAILSHFHGVPVIFVDLGYHPAE